MWPDTNVHAKRLICAQEANAIRAILTAFVVLLSTQSTSILISSQSPKLVGSMTTRLAMYACTMAIRRQMRRRLVSQTTAQSGRALSVRYVYIRYVYETMPVPVRMVILNLNIHVRLQAKSLSIYLSRDIVLF